MRKWLFLVVLLICPLFQSVDALWLVSYQTGERYQYVGGDRYYDEMRGQYVYIPIVQFEGNQALAANGVLYEVEMTPEEQIAMMKVMSGQW
mgnify:CR=1 FL=1